MKNKLFVFVLLVAIFPSLAQDCSIQLKNELIELSCSDTLIYRMGNAEFGEIRIKGSFGSKTIFEIENGYIKKETCYFENGKPSVLKNFKNKKLNGEYIEWYTNGNKAFTGHYSNGLADSIWTFYHNNRTIESQGEFLPDTTHLTPKFEIISTEHEPDGTISSGYKQFTNFSPIHGIWNYYDNEGVLIKTLEFNLGKLVSMEIRE